MGYIVGAHTARREDGGIWVRGNVRRGKRSKTGRPETFDFLTQLRNACLSRKHAPRLPRQTPSIACAPRAPPRPSHVSQSYHRRPQPQGPCSTSIHAQALSNSSTLDDLLANNVEPTPLTRTNSVLAVHLPTDLA